MKASTEVMLPCSQVSKYRLDKDELDANGLNLPNWRSDSRQDHGVTPDFIEGLPESEVDYIVKFLDDVWICVKSQLIILTLPTLSLL